MKVSELIEILEDQDPDAEVLIMSQQSWPFENAVHGVAAREDLRDDDDDDDEHDDGRRSTRESGAPSDVFIVEGAQLRYGSKAAWRVATR